MDVAATSSEPIAMTIAGFDPGSGAGITADLLTFASFGVFATSAITALTVQNTLGVKRVSPVATDLLYETLEQLEADLPASGIKLGMLGSASQVRVIVDYLRSIRSRRPVFVVLDPVIASSSGAALLDTQGLTLLISDLLPLVDAVTPNLREASMLTSLPCETSEQAEACARALVASFPNLTPIVTGGHWERPCDLVLEASRVTWLCGDHIDSRATHGTGCAFASALLAARLRGEDWTQAAATAKQFVRAAMASAIPMGSGRGPMNLLHR